MKAAIVTIRSEEQSSNMGDMRLFRVGDARIKELERRSGSIEKSLQTLIERNLDTLLGVHLVVSEYTHEGLPADPIDTIGIDENGAPVVVKYKRSLNENVVTQGLYYLDWLNDHRAVLEGLLGASSRSDEAPPLYWPARRLICIAGDFNRFDHHAATQMQRSIDLVEYCQFDIGFLMLFLKATTGDPAVAISSGEDAGSATAQLEAAPKALFDLFQSLNHFLRALGDDVQVQALRDHFVFRRMKSFAWTAVRPRARKIQLFLPLEPESVELEPGFSRPVRQRMPPGLGDVELTLKNSADLEKAKTLLERSYRLN